jgi:hypothetical protein
MRKTTEYTLGKRPGAVGPASAFCGLALAGRLLQHRHRALPPPRRPHRDLKVLSQSGEKIHPPFQGSCARAVAPHRRVDRVAQFIGTTEVVPFHKSLAGSGKAGTDRTCPHEILRPAKKSAGSQDDRGSPDFVTGRMPRGVRAEIGELPRLRSGFRRAAHTPRKRLNFDFDFANGISNFAQHDETGWKQNDKLVKMHRSLGFARAQASG